MKILKTICLICILLACFMGIGCTEEGGDVVAVQASGESSFDHSKGAVYNIDIWVKNEDTVSQTARVNVQLISNASRHSNSKTVDLQPDETKQVTFTFDRENGVDYDYTYYAEQL